MIQIINEEKIRYSSALNRKNEKKKIYSNSEEVLYYTGKNIMYLIIIYLHCISIRNYNLTVNRCTPEITCTSNGQLS